ncbi:hypothetical protein BC830DRAFT_1138937 [Chytriomyces sp. MP71]|nr:hypothetical protein BC830DRAFT_1138937 [Chytriomyces sp. MP71]
MVTTRRLCSKDFPLEPNMQISSILVAFLAALQVTAMAAPVPVANLARRESATGAHTTTGGAAPAKSGKGKYTGKSKGKHTGKPTGKYTGKPTGKPNGKPTGKPTKTYSGKKNKTA